MVPEAGLEPAHHCWREILNLLCLPISPLWHCVQAYIFLPRIQNSLLILNLLCLPISPLWHCVQAYRFSPRIQNSLLILNPPNCSIAICYQFHHSGINLNLLLSLWCEVTRIHSPNGFGSPKLLNRNLLPASPLWRRWAIIAVAKRGSTGK